MIVGVPRESYADERRVSLVPSSVQALAKAGLEVLVETGAGEAAGFPDQAFADRGASLVSREDVFARADVLVQVRGPDTGTDEAAPDLAMYRPGQAVIAMHDPLGEPERIKALAARGVTAFSLELVPRITRAQSMDVLSSMATIAGYQAVLTAAEVLPQLFPMLMTAAGTLAPAKVFVVGVGVAGLQAIATAKRLGAVVEAYDVRPAVKDQVMSVGAKFVEFDLATEDAEDQGGYAKEQSEDFIRRQQAQMKDVVARNDVVITTAAIPGKTSPVLVTAEMVAAMAPGSVIVDLAAERGGNCALTKADETVVAHGVTILGPTNLVSRKPRHASQMFAKNVETYLLAMIDEGALTFDMADEVVAETLLTRDGEVVHPRLRGLLGLEVADTEGGEA